MVRIEKDGEDGDGRFSLVLVTNKSIEENFIILAVSLSLSLSSNHCMHASVPDAGFLSSPHVGDEQQQHENTVLILAQSRPVPSARTLAVDVYCIFIISERSFSGSNTWSFSICFLTSG
jgi:hypothetical protein